MTGAAGGGIEAVDLADRLQPDVVPMDLRMPGMDGFEATRRIKGAVPLDAGHHLDVLPTPLLPPEGPQPVGAFAYRESPK